MVDELFILAARAASILAKELPGAQLSSDPSEHDTQFFCISFQARYLPAAAHALVQKIKKARKQRAVQFLLQVSYAANYARATIQSGANNSGLSCMVSLNHNFSNSAAPPYELTVLVKL